VLLVLIHHRDRYNRDRTNVLGREIAMEISEQGPLTRNDPVMFVDIENAPQVREESHADALLLSASPGSQRHRSGGAGSADGMGRSRRRARVQDAEALRGKGGLVVRVAANWVFAHNRSRVDRRCVVAGADAA
jgi:hypothetical protein